MNPTHRARAALSMVIAGILPLTGAGAVTAVAAPPAAPVSATPPEAGSAPDHPTALAHAVRAAAADAAPPAASDGTVHRDLDQALADLVDDGALAVTARVDAEGFSWSGARGVRELRGHSRARTTDRFRVASVTKMMIATLVLQEVENGTWSLDTSTEDVLPGALPRDVTIEQLLSHTSGAPTANDQLTRDHMTDPDDIDEYLSVVGDHYSEADHIRAAHTAPWVLEPGSGFSYSNAGFVTLGMMLEKVTGRSLDDLLEERVFDPAGMSDSDYPEQPGTPGRFLIGAAYTGAEGKGWYSTEHLDPTLFRAAGSVTSTTADLAAFADALVTGDLLRPGTVAEMLTPRSAVGYGFGIVRVPDPCVPGEYLYGHDGGGVGTMSVVLTSADGERVVTAGITGRNYSADPDALYELGDLLVPLFEATC
ncbi:serine hydrolase domain-containing protein [Promicromonospora iranensis]|uniref:serine hydrolase domain-containing protein n=1 Tax=Promicromonospora iranensis TaxID=1105144 RepID=UPI0023A98703|nr:serine hydrolase domain-containing protein [Promicromonospora iranensis]